jgi:hypothetical protein
VSYWVVFNNDRPLAVCLSQDQADRDVVYRRKRDQSPKLPGSTTTANYFHWHEVAASTTPLVVLRKRQAELLEACFETEGAELPKSDWPTAEQLVAKGLARLNGARGPGGQWRRLELTELGFQVAQRNVLDRRST